MPSKAPDLGGFIFAALFLCFGIYMIITGDAGHRIPSELAARIVGLIVTYMGWIALEDWIRKRQ